MSSDVMPVGNLTRDQVRTVMRACAAAPPIRDKRPWRLICTPTALELRAAPPTAETATDGSAAGQAQRPSHAPAGPDHREMLLSCGAALLNVRATIKMLGAHPAVQLIPDGDQPDLLAVVHPQAGSVAAAADVALADAIAQRRTSHPLTGGIPEPMINRLRRAARVEQTWLAILPPDQLADVQLGHLDGDVGDEGVGGDAGVRGPAGDARPTRLVAVIGSFHDNPLAWLQAGQGAQRVLLTAGAAGLTTSLLSQTVRDARTRAQVRQLIGGGVWPQAVVRLDSPARSSAPLSPTAAVAPEAEHRWVNH